MKATDEARQAPEGESMHDLTARMALADGPYKPAPEGDRDEALRLWEQAGFRVFHGDAVVEGSGQLVAITGMLVRLISLARASASPPQEPVAWRQVVQGYLNQGDWDRDTLEALLNDDRLSAAPDALDARRIQRDALANAADKIAANPVWFHDKTAIAIRHELRRMAVEINDALASEPPQEGTKS